LRGACGRWLGQQQQHMKNMGWDIICCVGLVIMAMHTEEDPENVDQIRLC
jgi:hypothetical protein